MVDQGILDWQNSLSEFGINYSGPKNGLMNMQFIAAMMALESKLKAYGELFTGSGVKISVTEAKKKYLTSKSSGWESFLSQNLPMVGKVYDGDLAVAGKKLEDRIGKFINKQIRGSIWSDEKQQFNTTPDDIKKSLDLIQSYQNSKSATLDQNRMVKMVELLDSTTHNNE